MKKECIAMLLAGGQGSRLYVLTENMAKPAVPFGGKFRIIDFPLSNCANAGIDTVGVLTQYRPLELNRYIGSGQPWDLDRADGGVHILPPYQSAGGASWYKGTANAIFQNIGFVDMYDPEYVLILSGDHIYKMNYAKMLAHHKKAGADCTISVMEVPWEDAPRFGIMNVDENDTITEFEEKPAHPKSNLASMGIYVFTWKKLRSYLIEVHSLKSTAANIGAQKLSERAAEHEAAAKSGNYDFIRSDGEQLIVEYRKLIDEISPYAEKHEHKKGGGDIGISEIHEKISEAADCIDRFDTGRAEALLDELMGAELPDSEFSAVTEASDLLGQFMYDEAKERLESVL